MLNFPKCNLGPSATSLCLFLIALGALLSLAVTASAQCESSCCDDPDLCEGRQLCVDDCTCQYASPILIDTTGKGFHLTSAEDGVFFDIAGDGKPIRIAWTAANSHNAFLALDRNHNGKIDSGKELFGNFTAQPKSDDRNGFLALAEFDKPENGGNGDGIIDKRDAVFPHLLLWIDENHDGISQPSELHTLPELGVYSISLRHRDDRHFFDGYGNWFHYQAALNPDPRDGESKDGRLAYDVFFMTAGEHNQSVRPSATPKSLSEPRLAADLRSDAIASSSNKAGTAQTVPYRYSLIVGKDRAPKVQVWNDYGAPITGIAVTVDLSDNIHQVESRTYYDTHVNLGLDFPIYQHESRLISIGYAPSSDVAKLTPRIRAVAFSDGTTVGERVWTDALMARRKHLYASLISLRGLLAEQTAGTPLKEVVEKLTGARKEMYSSIPKNEFRRVDDLVFDSAIRALNHARGDSTHVLKSYLNHLEAAIEDAAGSHLQTTSEPEIVPPHLDGRLSTRRNQQLFTPAASGAQLGRGLADRSGWLREYDPDRPRLINIASPALPTVTYTCTAITQNNPSDTECANPPANDYPTFTFVLTAEITATNSQTGAKTTTTFSTSGTAGGMCEYYTDCDGDLVNDDFPGYADPSGPDTEDDGTAVGTAFWWVLSNYAPGASGGCDCDDPDPYGTTWNYSFSNALTPTFWVAESGNTSSNCAGLVQELD